jgi:hypothetical protein
LSDFESVSSIAVSNCAGFDACASFEVVRRLTLSRDVANSADGCAEVDMVGGRYERCSERDVN